MEQQESVTCHKLSIRGREVRLRTEYDKSKISISAMYELLNPAGSSLTLTICSISSTTGVNAAAGSSSSQSRPVSVYAAVTVTAAAGHQFEMQLSRTLSAAAEWSLRLDAFIDTTMLQLQQQQQGEEKTEEETLSITVAVSTTPPATTTSMPFLEKSMASLSAPSPSPSRTFCAATARSSLFRGLMKQTPKSVTSPYPVRTCTIEVVSCVSAKLYTESKEWLCLHSPFFTALFYRDYGGEDEVNRCTIHSIEGESFDICSVFGSLLAALNGTYTPIVSTLVLADRFCMERVKASIVAYMLATDLSFLVTFSLTKWLREADVARCEQLVDKLLSRVASTAELLACYEELHETFAPSTGLKIARRMHALAEKAASRRRVVAKPFKTVNGGSSPSSFGAFNFDIPHSQ